MDKNYLDRETSARTAGRRADNEFERRCSAAGVNSRHVGEAMGVIAEAEATSVPRHPSGILAPIRSR